MNLAIIIVCLVLIIYSILVLGGVNISSKLTDFVQHASEKTQFQNCYFLIYDRSTENDCNRLIVINPFAWIVLAKNEKVYVVTDMQYDCPVGSFSCTRIHKNPDLFEYVCMKGSTISLLENYKNNNRGIYRIPFDVEKLQVVDNKFTVLDALNYLFKNYITIKEENADEEKIELISGRGYSKVNNSTKYTLLNMQNNKTEVSRKKRSTTNTGGGPDLLTHGDGSLKGLTEISRRFHAEKLIYFQENPKPGILDNDLRPVTREEADIILNRISEQDKDKFEAIRQEKRKRHEAELKWRKEQLDRVNKKN